MYLNKLHLHQPNKTVHVTIYYQYQAPWLVTTIQEGIHKVTNVIHLGKEHNKILHE